MVQQAIFPKFSIFLHSVFSAKARDEMTKRGNTKTKTRQDKTK